MWVKRSGAWWPVRYTDASGFENGYQAWCKRSGQWWPNSFIFETKDTGWFIKWWDASEAEWVWVQVLPPPGEAQPAHYPAGATFDLAFTRPQRGLPPRLREAIEIPRQLGWTAGVLRKTPPGVTLKVWTPAGTTAMQARGAILPLMDPSWKLTVSSVT
jgi:hypothetical protein